MNYGAVEAAVVGAVVVMFMILIAVVAMHYKKLWNAVTDLERRSQDDRVSAANTRESVHLVKIRVDHIDHTLHEALAGSEMQSLASPNEHVRMIRFPKHAKV